MPDKKKQTKNLKSYVSYFRSGYHFEYFRCYKKALGLALGSFWFLNLAANQTPINWNISQFYLLAKIQNNCNFFPVQPVLTSQTLYQVQKCVAMKSKPWLLICKSL